MSTPDEKFRTRVSARCDQMSEMVLDRWVDDPNLRAKVDALSDHFEANGQTGLAVVLQFAAMKLSLMVIAKQQDTEGEES